MRADKRTRIVQRYQAQQLTMKEICAMIGLSNPTLDAYVRQAQVSSSASDK